MQWLIALLPITLAGCASLLGVEELPGGDAGVDGPDLIEVGVGVTRDGLPADGVVIVGHDFAGDAVGLPITSALATVPIPPGGMVSVLFETGPGQFGLRTWTDLQDGDVLTLELGTGNEVIAETVIEFDQQVPASATRFEFQLRCTGGGISSTMAPVSVTAQERSLSSRCLGSDSTIDIIARVGTSDTASHDSVRTVGLDEIGADQSIVMPPWTPREGLAQFPITGRPIEQLLVRQQGEYRSGDIFQNSFGPRVSGDSNASSAFIELDFTPRFAELVAVEVTTNEAEQGGDTGGSLTAFAAPMTAEGSNLIVADTIDATTLDIDDLENLETARVPRPAVSWTVSAASVELDAVLFTINLFDVASPSKTLTWAVVSPPERGRVELPGFPDGLILQPGELQGWNSGEVTAFASTDHQGYRSFRAAGGLTTDSQGRVRPRQRSAGTLRVWRESLVPP